MKATELNAEILRNMSIVVEDESLTKQLARYLRRLVAKKNDSTLMTKEKFLGLVEKAEEQYSHGEYYEISPDEDLSTQMRRLGYNV